MRKCLYLLAGSIIGYIAGYMFSKKKYEERLDYEVKSVKDTYKKLNEIRDAEEVEEDAALRTLTDLADEYTGHVDYTTYSGDSNSKKSPEEKIKKNDDKKPINEKTEEKVEEKVEEKTEEKTEEKVEEKTEENKNNYTGAYKIEPDEFDLFDDFEDVYLTWYPYAKYTEGESTILGVLIEDETDEIISQEDALESVGSFSDGDFDDGVLYIRNDEKKCDYEITMSQSDIIL